MPDGLEQLNEAATQLKIDLVALVAATAIWANPKVHTSLCAQHASGAYFPRTRRYRTGDSETRGAFTDTDRLDGNNYANHAIRQAVGIPRAQLTNYHACHIWPQSCYDSRCHTVVANLVLLPSPLATLSDHHSQVIAALQYRAYKLFSWFPPNESAPRRPSHYPSNWREPEPFTPRIQASLNARHLEYLERF